MSSKNLGIEGKNLGRATPAEVAKKKVLALGLNKSTTDNLITILQRLECGQVFGASEIIEILNCSPPTATAIIKKMKALSIVEAVTGKGKGKYRLKVG